MKSLNPGACYDEVSIFIRNEVRYEYLFQVEHFRRNWFMKSLTWNVLWWGEYNYKNWSQGWISVTGWPLGGLFLIKTPHQIKFLGCLLPPPPPPPGLICVYGKKRKGRGEGRCEGGWFARGLRYLFWIERPKAAVGFLCIAYLQFCRSTMSISLFYCLVAQLILPCICRAVPSIHNCVQCTTVGTPLCVQCSTMDTPLLCSVALRIHPCCAV
jgi:hypothetical protein